MGRLHAGAGWIAGDGDVPVMSLKTDRPFRRYNCATSWDVDMQFEEISNMRLKRHAHKAMRPTLVAFPHKLKYFSTSGVFSLSFLRFLPEGSNIPCDLLFS